MKLKHLTTKNLDGVLVPIYEGHSASEKVEINMFYLESSKQFVLGHLKFNGRTLTFLNNGIIMDKRFDLI